ncbi:MAG TPA: OB-fold domain-containing protein [Acidimicrobiales bacterium]|nr:OB-fold domain-containing protein [Acidimicrobiales bacterium]
MSNAAAFSGGYTANLGPSVEGYLLPAVDPESEFFWLGARAGELRIQVCDNCGKLRHPPRPMCPSCRSTARSWKPMSGRGTVWSYVIPHPPLLKPYADIAPYNVVVVTLDEDPHLRLVGNLVPGPDGELNDIDPYSIEIGEPVEVAFKWYRRADGSEEALPMWVRTA